MGADRQAPAAHARGRRDRHAVLDGVAQAGLVAAPLDLIAMSDAVAEALCPLPARSLTIAARPDGAAMLAACLERLRPNGP